MRGMKRGPELCMAYNPFEERRRVIPSSYWTCRPGWTPSRKLPVLASQVGTESPEEASANAAAGSRSSRASASDRRARQSCPAAGFARFPSGSCIPRRLRRPWHVPQRALHGSWGTFCFPSGEPPGRAPSAEPPCISEEVASSPSFCTAAALRSP